MVPGSSPGDRTIDCLGGEIGRHKGLIENLSALLETVGVELVKFGKRFKMPIPSQALLANSEREGVETRRRAPKIERYGEGIVQTTNRKLVVKTIVVRKSLAFRKGRAGSTPARGTTHR